jgi:ribonuclease T1
MTMAQRFSLKLVLTCLLFASVFVSAPAGARAPAPADSAAAVSVSELPPEGARTYRLILQGGPFPYEKDGVVFGNRERRLPAQKRGYYHEYTVPTPGAGNRGTQRIVCGGQPKAPETCYFTADHYASFRRIVP